MEILYLGALRLQRCQLPRLLWRSDPTVRSPWRPSPLHLAEPALLSVLSPTHGRLITRAWDGFCSHCLMVPPRWSLPQGPFFSFHSAWLLGKLTHSVTSATLCMLMTPQCLFVPFQTSVLGSRLNRTTLLGALLRHLKSSIFPALSHHPNLSLQPLGLPGRSHELSHPEPISFHCPLLRLASNSKFSCLCP